MSKIFTKLVFVHYLSFCVLSCKKVQHLTNLQIFGPTQGQKLHVLGSRPLYGSNWEKYLSLSSSSSLTFFIIIINVTLFVAVDLVPAEQMAFR